MSRAHASASLHPSAVTASCLSVYGKPVVYLKGHGSARLTQWMDGSVVAEMATEADSAMILDADAARQLAADILAALDEAQEVAA